jgi:hypothetical protein
MKKNIVIITLLLTVFTIRCDVLQQLEIPTGGLTKDEIVRGLKEALKVGTEEAVKTLARENGFYLDDQVKIPFPGEVKYVEEKLRALGLGSLVDNFVKQMNHAAENAVDKAGPIFYDAIREMTISDAVGILNGNDHAATEYFREKTYGRLVEAFKPDISTVLNTMHVSDYWSKVTRAYNKLPLTKKVETDLPQYVTEKAIDGLFVKVADEEKKIREDPKARTTELLQKVFAQAGHAVVK